MKSKVYTVSLNTYFPGNPKPTKHYQDLTLREIPKWIEAYKFTHPGCEAVTVKVWFNGLEKPIEE